MLAALKLGCWGALGLLLMSVSQLPHNNMQMFSRYNVYHGLSLTCLIDNTESKVLKGNNNCPNDRAR